MAGVRVEVCPDEGRAMRPALCGGKPNDLAAGTVSHQSNFLAAPLNGTENPQNDGESGECRLNTTWEEYQK